MSALKTMRDVNDESISYFLEFYNILRSKKARYKKKLLQRG